MLRGFRSSFLLIALALCPFDVSANDVEAAMQIILGSAKSMGIEVKG